MAMINKMLETSAPLQYADNGDNRRDNKTEDDQADPESKGDPGPQSIL